MKRYTPLKRTGFKQRIFDPDKYKNVPGVINMYMGKSEMVYPIRSPLRKRSKSNGQMVILPGKTVMLWSLGKADDEFSVWIRKRDGKCLKCGSTENLTNSHFHGRSHKATRYHPDACDTFCVYCHAEWETEKKGEYRLWKINQLGQERLDALEALARTTVKQSDVIKEVMIFLLQPTITNLAEINI